jgi:phosphonatase-like hydrolase
MRIKGVIFDFIGTTVIEKDPSLLNRCFVQAFSDHQLTVPIEIIQANRGKDKKEMIGEILQQSNVAVTLTGSVLQAFRFRLQNDIHNFHENTGAADMFHHLRKKKIKIGLGSGLPRDIFETILDHIGWKEPDFDYIGIAEEIGKGRPHPAMLLDMMDKCRLRKKELLKVGDTVADVEEGRNAGVITVAILSGTQAENKIIASRPDFIIHSLQELNAILSGLPA